MDVVALVVGLVALVGAIVGSCFAQRMPAAVGWLSGGVGFLAIGWAILNAGPLLPVLQAQDDWSNEALYETLVAVAAERGVKNSIILWPLRVAVSGKASTPGGATELCALLGKEESLRRIEAGIALLRK